MTTYMHMYICIVHILLRICTYIDMSTLSSTCMPAPLDTYDQREKLPRANLFLRLRSLSEGDTPTG